MLIGIAVAAAGVCCPFAVQAALDFNGLNVNLVGAATIPGSGPNAGNLLLTPSAIGVVGAAWLTTPVSTTSPFSTTFSFSISNPGLSLGHGDGLALVFHNSGTSALGTGGGTLGIDLPDNTTLGGSVAAEFQSFWSTYGIVQNTNADGGAFSLSLGSPVDLSETTLITGTETVTYNPVTHLVSQNLNLSYTHPVDGSGFFSRDTNATFNLESLFGPTMTVGLSASTGGATSDQAITSWSLAPVPEPSFAFFGLALCGVSLWRRRRRAA